MGRKKQEKIQDITNEDANFNDNANNTEEFSDIEEPTEVVGLVTEKVTNKQFGIVTLVTNKYVVYDLNGKSIYKRGKFNYSIGDKIEV